MVGDLFQLAFFHLYINAVSFMIFFVKGSEVTFGKQSYLLLAQFIRSCLLSGRFFKRIENHLV